MQVLLPVVDLILVVPNSTPLCLVNSNWSASSYYYYSFFFTTSYYYSSSSIYHIKAVGLPGFKALRPQSSCLYTNLATSQRELVYLDIDAMGKPQSGVTMGNLAWFGSYGECQNLTGAHYCLASIKINLRNGNKVSTK